MLVGLDLGSLGPAVRLSQRLSFIGQVLAVVDDAGAVSRGCGRRICEWAGSGHILHLASNHLLSTWIEGGAIASGSGCSGPEPVSGVFSSGVSSHGLSHGRNPASEMSLTGREVDGSGGLNDKYAHTLGGNMRSLDR
jgi:hypothetical protein